MRKLDLYLKRTFLLSVFFFWSFQSASETNVSTLLEINNTREVTEAMVDEAIAIYQKRYPNTSVMVWGAIKGNIDYGKYYKKIKLIYSTNYSDAEISELIRLHRSKNINLYKAKAKKIEPQLYVAGKEFGKELSLLIISKVK